MDIIYIEALPDVFATFDDCETAEDVRADVAIQRLDDVD